MGRVVRVDVVEGSTVRAGQPLVWLDSRDLAASVDQAEAGAGATSVAVETALVAARMERGAAEAPDGRSGDRGVVRDSVRSHLPGPRHVAHGRGDRLDPPVADGGSRSESRDAAS
ncbi:MAG: biotin/lipoyl-binding protein [Armatimonadetes bacterium]|nr:biotin/lipoyl-binding protein [Armatimonadota bacterium]